MTHLLKKLLASSLFLLAGTAFADDIAAVNLVISQHRFQPAEITVPANTKVKLVIDNQDNTAEEFESHALNREKVIPANKTGVIFIGPLKPGKYEFFGEFHPSTAKGTVIVK